MHDEIDEMKKEALKTINRLRERTLPDLATQTTNVRHFLIAKQRQLENHLSNAPQLSIEEITQASEQMAMLSCKIASPEETISVEYTTTKKGFFSRREATLLVFSNGELVQSHHYKLPTKKKPLAESDRTRLVETIEAVVLKESRSQEDEQRIVATVANATGISQLISAYYQRRSVQIFAGVHAPLAAYFVDALSTLSEASVQIRETTAQLQEEQLVAFIREEKERAKTKIDQVTQELEERVSVYETEFHKTLNERRESLEQEYQQKSIIINARLEGQRKKIHEDAFKIGSALEEIFPDRIETEWEIFVSYSERVDRHLRKFYEGKLINDLGETQHASVDDAVLVLRLLKQHCVHKRNKASGSEMKTCYAGFRAFLAYVSTNEIDTQTAITKLLSYADRLNGKEKPSVEDFLEGTFPYDVDMSVYTEDLHDCYATEKEGLGLK